MLGGETLGGIAEQYGMTLEDVVLINQMQDPAFDPDFLSIGQQIVILANVDRIWFGMEHFGADDDAVGVGGEDVEHPEVG